ncbi:unnamed protein product [Trifolium pratense]|uniref:Uncharacterized protein n=1 Tax=Trifolium pratense TaxID=57577 RepID=A0ACB0ISR3_TRIPR|nr:unnamed protein product [Trifolium pratense]
MKKKDLRYNMSFNSSFHRCTFIFFILVISLRLSCSSQVDEVTRLPNQPKVGFKQYAGYVFLDHDRALFYYFVEAQLDPASKPLVLWLNGGPGCSSIGQGAFGEHGPFKPTRKGHLVKNHYSWNREANMIYLDSPVGVGFSFSVNQSSYYLVNDEMTARDNLLFLQGWFTKFPKYKNNDFFITGESYAGHYAPQLEQLILQTKSTNINLKEIAIGNPLLEFNRDFNSDADFWWSHGQIKDSTFQMLKTVCNYSTIRRQGRSGKLSPNCSEVNQKLSMEVGGYTDTFDVIADMCPPPEKHQAYVLTEMQAAAEKIDVCVEDETVTYLNRKEVYNALNAKLVGITHCSTCSSVLVYNFQNLEIPTISLLGRLVKSGVRVVVYSGDQDSMIPFIGTRSLINELAKDLGLNITEEYRAWFRSKHVAGWTEVYGDILTFATIRGAGHAAPFYQPGRSLLLFKAFLDGNPLPNRH